MKNERVRVFGLLRNVFFTAHYAVMPTNYACLLPQSLKNENISVRILEHFTRLLPTIIILSRFFQMRGVQ